MSNLDKLPKESFFKREHYETFVKEKIHLNSPNILEERKNVQLRLLELHDEVYPEIKKKSWSIDKHNSPEHLVSGIDINNPYIANQVSAVWLHYGKMDNEIKKYKKYTSDKNNETFINHIRLQVIITSRIKTKTKDFGVGIWLVVGKNNGSVWDRDNIKNRLKNEEKFQKEFSNLINQLGKDYFIEVNNSIRECNSFKDPNDFVDFVKSDDLKNYFIIGKDFLPNEEELKETKITVTVMLEFSILYKLYCFLKHKIDEKY